MTDIPMKRCFTCKQAFPATPEYFNKQACQKSGLHPSCITCVRAYNAQRRAVYRTEATQQRLDWREEKRTLEAQGLRRCSKCHEVYPLTAEFFPKNAGARTGLEAHCRNCERAYTSEAARQRKNPEQLLRAERRANDPILAEQGLKRCHACQQVKPRDSEHFGAGTTRPDGFSDRCLDCSRKAAATYRRNHPDKVKASHDKDYHNEYSRRWAKKHPEQRRATERRYAKKHPEKAVLVSAKRRALKRLTKASLTTQEWKRCLDYWHNRCAACGKEADLFTVIAQDHWHPLSKGGAHSATNIVPLCHTRPNGGEQRCCNVSKRNRPPEEWVIWRFGERKGRQILARIDAYFAWVVSLQNNAVGD